MGSDYLNILTDRTVAFPWSVRRTFMLVFDTPVACYSPAPDNNLVVVYFSRHLPSRISGWEQLSPHASMRN